MSVKDAIKRLDAIEELYCHHSASSSLTNPCWLMREILVELGKDEPVGVTPQMILTIDDHHERLEDIERRVVELELREQRRTYNDVCEDLKKEPSNGEGRKRKYPTTKTSDWIDTSKPSPSSAKPVTSDDFDYEPTKFITIPRFVAEEWSRYTEGAFATPTIKRINDAIRTALGK